MPFEKLSDPPQLCRHPDHDPWAVGARTLEPGRWRHICAGCERVTEFTLAVPGFDPTAKPVVAQIAEIQRELATVDYCTLETLIDGRRVACAREYGHAGNCDFLRVL